jgi:hypothetical protein
MRHEFVNIDPDLSKFNAAMKLAADNTALLAWRLDGFAATFRDEQLLSIPVLDAWRGWPR